MTFRGRLAVIADGDPRLSSTNSGVARGITTALSHRVGDDRIIPIDGSINGIRRVLLAILTFRPNTKWWFTTRNAGLLNIVWRSVRRERHLEDADFVLHVRNLYLPSRRPYAVFIDSTTNMSKDSWNEWRPSPPLEKARRFIETWQYQRACFVFTAGQQAADDVVENYGIDASKVAAIGGGINFDPEILQRPLHAAQKGSDGPLILFVGRDYHRKGGDLVLAAFRKVRANFPATRLMIVGCKLPGPAPDGVEVLPQVTDRGRMAQIYCAADIFCLPTRHEPYGLVILEAMAFGLPVVATEVGAIPSIVRHERTGLTVPSDDEGTLTAALTLLVSDERVRQEYGARSREIALREHTWDRVAERMLDLLGRTIPIPVRAMDEPCTSSADGNHKIPHV